MEIAPKIRNVNLWNYRENRPSSAGDHHPLIKAIHAAFNMQEVTPG